MPHLQSERGGDPGVESHCEGGSGGVLVSFHGLTLCLWTYILQALCSEVLRQAALIPTGCARSGQLRPGPGLGTVTASPLGTAGPHPGVRLMVASMAGHRPVPGRH